MYIGDLIIDSIIGSKTLAESAGLTPIRREKYLSDWDDSYVRMCIVSKLLSAFSLSLHDVSHLFVTLKNKAIAHDMEALDVIQLLDSVLLSNSELVSRYLDRNRELVSLAEKRGRND